MKKFLTSRAGAIVVAVVIILLSTYFGAYRSLSVAVGEVSNGFDEGVYYTDESGNAYLHKSIRSQLINRSEACISLASIADTFTEAADEADELRAAYNELRDLLYNEGTPAELCAADRKMNTAFNALYDTLSAVELDVKDAKRLSECQTEMKGAAGEIENSGYNKSVRDFTNETLSVFPTNILKTICFVDEPELFE